MSLIAKDAAAQVASAVDVGRPPNPIKTTQITLVLPNPLMDQIARLEVLWSRPGIPVTRTDVIRAAVLDAVPRFLAQAGEAPAPAQAALPPEKRTPAAKKDMAIERRMKLHGESYEEASRKVEAITPAKRPKAKR